MGQIEVIHGDMFDGACDMIVIPCSFHPTITRHISKRLVRFGVDGPTEQIEPGEVTFRALPKTAESVSRLAAYAASVGAVGETTSTMVEAIARSLAEFAAQDPSVSSIHAPLLGTGAGGLDPVQSALAMSVGFLSNSTAAAVLRLFVLDADHYQTIKDLVASEQSGIEVSDLPLPPRVFVSYAGGTPAHNDWVKELASRLRDDGIDARLDAWHLAHGMDMAQWMCNELDQADRVVLVCDELYGQKADRRHGGVGWEIRLVQGEMLADQQENPDRFLPIVVTETVDVGLPAFLKAAYAFHWPNGRRSPDQYRELVRAIYRAQEQAPPIGQPPAFVLGAPN